MNRLPQQGSFIVNKINEAINAARKKDITVIFVRLGFEKGMPEVNANNNLFFAFKNKLDSNHLVSYMKLHPDLEIKENDIILNKKRVSAFCGNSLDMILRAKNITHLVLSGISTSGVVLSSLREAFDKDYSLTVLSDGCVDPDKGIHDFLTEKIFPKQAKIVTIDEWKTISV